MFDIGFSELIVVGVVALIVIGPERLPKVARTAGHLLGRFQRYAAGVKSDISREMQMEELRKVGDDFKQSIESAASGVKTQVNAVDAYLRDEIGQTEQSLMAMATPGAKSELGEADITELDDASAAYTEPAPHPQQSLDLDARPAAVIEYAPQPVPQKNPPV